MAGLTSNSADNLLGRVAPDFALPAPDGEYHSLYDFRGRQLVLVFLRHFS